MTEARARARRAGQGERGSVTVSFALMLPVLCGFAVAALVLSREALERRELQSAADALALAAAHSVEQLGNNPFQRGPAEPLPAKNARLKTNWIRIVDPMLDRPAAEHRAVICISADTVFNSQQGWFPKTFLPLKVTSCAQVNENIYGDRWPAIIFVLDNTQSMNQPLLGASGTPAYQTIQQLVAAYASNTLPVRNGVILFNRTVVGQSQPPPDNVNNLAGIQAAFVAAGNPKDLTGLRGAIDRARQHLTGMTGGRNVVLVTEGEATVGPCGADQHICHMDEAALGATQLRNLIVEGDGVNDGVSLFSLEIRHSNYWTEASKLMQRMAGKPMSAGNDPNMTFMAQNVIGIQQFITGMTRSVCMFGPFDPKLGEPTAAASRDRVASPLRGRPGNPDLNSGRRRIFAFLRDANMIEHPLPIVPNRDLVPAQQGFEYVTAGADGFVILTLASCNYLGADNKRRLVVRWDDPELVPRPN